MVYITGAVALDYYQVGGTSCDIDLEVKGVLVWL